MSGLREEKKRFAPADLAYIAMGAACIAVCSWISIPTAVPFTMQTFAVFFVLFALGGKRGAASIVLYVLLGAVGLPVFAQFTSGIGILLGNTGGYIVGFIVMGLAYWLIVGLLGERLWAQILAAAVGLILLYLFGTLWFLTVYAEASGAAGVSAVVSMCVAPFVVPDLVKLGLALLLAKRLPLPKRG